MYFIRILWEGTLFAPSSVGTPHYNDALDEFERAIKLVAAHQKLCHGCGGEVSVQLFQELPSGDSPMVYEVTMPKCG